MEKERGIIITLNKSEKGQELILAVESLPGTDTISFSSAGLVLPDESLMEVGKLPDGRLGGGKGIPPIVIQANWLAKRLVQKGWQEKVPLRGYFEEKVDVDESILYDSKVPVTFDINRAMS